MAGNRDVILADFQVGDFTLVSFSLRVSLCVQVEELGYGVEFRYVYDDIDNTGALTAIFASWNGHFFWLTPMTEGQFGMFW